MRSNRKPPCGCFGSLAVIVVVTAIAYCAVAPFTFRLGGRWTPVGRWNGVGRLRDSAGAQYGMYLRFGPYVEFDSRSDGMSVCCELSGKAQVCTAGGARYPFDVRGGISGAWLHTDGSKVNVSLAEPGHPKLPRQFDLSGFWRGPNLVLDDQKSMFIHFLPGGNLTPAPSYTSPVPERHATVTVSWGSLSDFEALCASLSDSRR